MLLWFPLYFIGTPSFQTNDPSFYQLLPPPPPLPPPDEPPPEELEDDQLLSEELDDDQPPLSLPPLKVALGSLVISWPNDRMDRSIVSITATPAKPFPPCSHAGGASAISSNRAIHFEETPST
jgi:hypothetical protein